MHQLFNRFLSPFNVNQGNLKTVQSQNDFGFFKFQSSDLTDEKVKEYQEKLSQVKSEEEFFKVCNLIQNENSISNKFYSEFNNMEHFFDRFTKPEFLDNFPKIFTTQFPNFLHGFQKPTNEDIDKEIQRLEVLKEKNAKDNENKLLENKKNELKANIQNLKNNLSSKSKELIDNLDNELLRGQINQEMIDINNQIKLIHKDLESYDLK
jgi:hypothetical protein